MLNDETETRWGYSAFEEAATRLIKRIDIPDSIPEISIDFCDSVDGILSGSQLIVHPFVSCFSLNGDNLGQWRTYADDGRGFAIGFRASMLKQLPVTMLSVEYDRGEQVKEMMAALLAIHARKNSEEENERGEFFEDCVLTATYFAGLKHSAFQEEKEIRCVHAVNVKMEEEIMHFVDAPNVCEDWKSQPVKFQVQDNHLCAYMDLPFWHPNGQHPVSEIFLGPKNHSVAANVLLYLGGLGYSNVGIKRSKVPYR
ncbi:DUF2971 domain-containing protein [Methyloglobulus sp.]|uniref:DUF2971 domain-containing protein n=1 Tax=Methyloglobulus sp. TaxID=2518622 RepID=UPI00398A423C